MDLMEIIRIKQDLQQLYGQRLRLMRHIETADKRCVKFIRMRKQDLIECESEIKKTEATKNRLKGVPGWVWDISLKLLFLLRLEELFTYKPTL